ncbi:MAG: efflux RND transporter permease subunit [Sphingomonas sp.]|uniref:efflux RND transporter permease subunit n=1 Tax=Sphingomonas sp. TaxID=28214 RepID=UPI0025F8844F|nr:efflux RND transporter permease subunit [Sphingomonas sp.]MBQ1498990.1 efflux RND transporter permease subunit [Sphingomonas sp.]
MNLAVSAWAIRNPIPVCVLFALLTLAGIWAYLALPVKQLPDTSFPIVAVNVTQSGAAPAELETQVARVAENAVAGIPGVKHVFSTVTNGHSTTLVEFRIGENQQKAIDEVRTAIDRIRADLPRGIDPPVVERVDIDAVPVLTFAVAAPMSDVDLSWYVDDRVARTLQAVPGVSSIRRLGGVNREIIVSLLPERLAAHGLTAAQVSQALRAALGDNAGGRVELGEREETVRVLASPRSAEALRAVELPLGEGRSVPLSAVAEIGDGAAEPRSFARLDGRPVIGFEVMKTKPASDISVEDAANAAIAKLAREGRGVRFTRIVSSADETRAEFSATIEVLVEGMALAALVVWLFLRTWRSTLIAAVAMPISLLPTFAVMLALGFTLNMVSLLALTLVIGILVDDAIVEIENIEKRIEGGESPYRASMIGADQIGLAVIATTFAIVVVFLPVSLMGGVVGQYFREFGITVAVAVLFSLLVARLLTPLMCAYLLVPARTPHARPPMAGWYRRILDWALDRPGLSILLAFLFFVGSLGLASLLPTAFIPESNPKNMVFNMVAAPGSTRADLDRASGEATRILKGDPDVASVFVRFGGEMMNNGALTVVFREDRAGTAAAFKRRMAPALRDVRDVRITPAGQGGGAADLEVILVGSDPAALEAAARRVQREMQGIAGLRNVRPAEPPASAELVIRPRLAEAARLGVTAEAIADTARIATIGDIDANLAKLPIDGRNLPARALLPAAARLDSATIAGLRVPVEGGGTTRLDAVADIGFETGPGRIERIDRERRATIQADLSGLTLGQATDAVAALPGMKVLPAGVRQELYGDSEAMSELFGGFIGAMIAGIGMIFAVLVLLFRSFFKPVTILTALPLAVGGAFAGLLLGGFALSLPAMIGFLMLLGLAAKNSILLVEYAIERERDGVPRRAALVEACHERARPIVMTTVAMAAGMVPTALGIGEGSEFRQPMAVAVIGGLISSTALSLVLVPVVYEAIDALERWLAPRFGRLVRQPDPGEVAALRAGETLSATAPVRP